MQHLRANKMLTFIIQIIIIALIHCVLFILSPRVSAAFAFHFGAFGSFNAPIIYLKMLIFRLILHFPIEVPRVLC